MSNEITTIVSIAAIVISLFNSWVGYQNRRLVLQQEKRKRPELVPSLVSSHFIRERDGTQVYHFEISIANPTDTNNSVSQAELLIGYTTEAGVDLNMRAPARSDPDRSSLGLPASVTAHTTVQGAFAFVAPGQVLKTSRIRSYRLHFMDTHGESFYFEPLLMRERIDEVKPAEG